jgi:hypothetical protein
VLAKKMPQFKAGSREGGEHLKSHKQIHDGEFPHSPEHDIDGLEKAWISMENS